MRALERLRRPESLPWLFLAAMFVALIALIAASVASFLSVADAHARTTMSVSSSAAYTGVSASGALLDTGNLTFTIFFHVDDPTSRGLTFFTVGYKVWLEDAPAEAHLSGTTRSPADVQVTNASGSFLFFRAFDGSKQVSPLPVPANGNATMAYPLILNRSNNPNGFAAVQNITEYAANVLGGTSHIAWNVWVLVNLNIDGIPPPSSLSQADYFAAVSRVQFIEGDDFGAIPVGHP